MEEEEKGDEEKGDDEVEVEKLNEEDDAMAEPSLALYFELVPLLDCLNGVLTEQRTGARNRASAIQFWGIPMF